MGNAASQVFLTSDGFVHERLCDCPSGHPVQERLVRRDWLGRRWLVPADEEWQYAVTTNTRGVGCSHVSRQRHVAYRGRTE